MQFSGIEYPDVKLPCNRENMTKLVEALESGNYKQGQGYLLTIDPDGTRRHCCLGVASEISGLGSWTPYASGDPEHPRYTADGRWSNSILVTSVMNWLGVYDSGLTVTGPNEESNETLVASELNDSTVRSNGQAFDFNAIAARIRQVYLTD